MNEKLRTFKIEVDDIENVDFEHGMIQEIAKAYADAMDLKRYELVLNKNIITIKDKITGINSYMGMKVSLEPLEKDISFIVRPRNQPTYEELQQENEKYKEVIDKIDKKIKDFIKCCKAEKIESGSDFLHHSYWNMFENFNKQIKEILKEVK